MKSIKKMLAFVLPVLALGAAAVALSGGRLRVGSDVQLIDFGTAVTPTSPAYRAALAPAGDAPVKEFRIPIMHDTVTIADGVRYAGWTFGGTVPGPVLRVRQGDLVRIHLVNQSTMPHSIDLHAARIPMDVGFKTILPGQDLTFEFTARDPGAFMVHCGTPPVLMHIMQGMYMAIIVDPKDGWPTKADEEYVLIQSEFYAQPGANGAPETADWQAALDRHASYVVFNGRAFQYKANPLSAKPGDRVRLFVVNAGPNFVSDFHVVGTIFDRVYPDGNVDHPLEGVQTWPIPAGGGDVFETVFAKKGSAGNYAFVTHSFADAEKGAVGLIHVQDPSAIALGTR